MTPPLAEPIHVAALAQRNGWRSEPFGESVNGVPLVAWWPTMSKPTRVVWAAIHGEEASTLLLTHQLLRTVHADDACAVVVPVLNPDGVLLGTRQNARGVDLNRNFPAASWISDASPSFWPTTLTRSDERRTQMSSPGTAPASEPETQAIVALVERVQPTAVVDVHAPLECVIAMHDRAVEFATHLAEPAQLPVVRELTSPTYGDSAAWTDGLGIVSVTYEVELAAVPHLWHRHRDALARALVAALPGHSW